MLKWGSKKRPPPSFFYDFGSRVGGRGGPTRESKASQDEDQIPDLIRAHQKTRPFLPEGRRRIWRLAPLPPTPSILPPFTRQVTSNNPPKDPPNPRRNQHGCIPTGVGRHPTTADIDASAFWRGLGPPPPTPADINMVANIVDPAGL